MYGLKPVPFKLTHYAPFRTPGEGEEFPFHTSGRAAPTGLGPVFCTLSQDFVLG